NAFAPEVVLISAGFDAHREDEMGQLGMVESDYGWITDQIVTVAQRSAQGRIVSMLEGGYNLSALGRSVAAHIRSLSKLYNKSLFGAGHATVGGQHGLQRHGRKAGGSSRLLAIE